MLRHWIWTAMLAASTASLCWAQGASGQDHPPLRGKVLDAETGNPIHGAFVSFSASGRGVFTDSLGFFGLPSESPAPYKVRVTQLGYHGLEREVTPENVGRPVMVQLAPDPIEMEGLTVLARRLSERRMGPFGVGEFLNQADLLSAPDGSGYDLVVRMMPFAQRCDMETEALCLAGRTAMGERRQMTVCVDGQRVAPDFIETALQGVRPQTLYLVEVYSRAGEVRMYSPAYVERMMGAGASLPPLSFGCGGIPGIGGTLP